MRADPSAEFVAPVRTRHVRRPRARIGEVSVAPWRGASEKSRVVGVRDDVRGGVCAAASRLDRTRNSSASGMLGGRAMAPARPMAAAAVQAAVAAVRPWRVAVSALMADFLPSRQGGGNGGVGSGSGPGQLVAAAAEAVQSPLVAKPGSSGAGVGAGGAVGGSDGGATKGCGFGSAGPFRRAALEHHRDR